MTVCLITANYFFVTWAKEENTTDYWRPWQTTAEHLLNYGLFSYHVLW